jgi:hypothetical protein
MDQATIKLFEILSKQYTANLRIFYKAECMSVADKISVAAELVPASEAKVGEESNST